MKAVAYRRADVIKRAHQRIDQRLRWRDAPISRRIGPSSAAMDGQHGTASADQYSLGGIKDRPRTSVRRIGGRHGRRAAGTGDNGRATTAHRGAA